MDFGITFKSDLDVRREVKLARQAEAESRATELGQELDGWLASLPTTVLNETGSVDGHALDLLPEMVARYAPRKEAIP